MVLEGMNEVWDADGRQEKKSLKEGRKRKLKIGKKKRLYESTRE